MKHSKELTALLDVLNKYMTDAQMPVVSSTYWNMDFGSAPELVEQDAEGLQTLRNLGRNMTRLLKCIRAGRSRGLCLPVRRRTIGPILIGEVHHGIE